jgi:hypothetical protein
VRRSSAARGGSVLFPTWSRANSNMLFGIQVHLPQCQLTCESSRVYLLSRFLILFCADGGSTRLCFERTLHEEKVPKSRIAGAQPFTRNAFKERRNVPAQAGAPSRYYRDCRGVQIRPPGWGSVSAGSAWAYRRLGK